MTTTTTRAAGSSPPRCHWTFGPSERVSKIRRGTQVIRSASAFEVRVEVFASPGPGTMRVEPGDALYVVLDGNGVLGVSKAAR